MNISYTITFIIIFIIYLIYHYDLLNNFSKCNYNNDSNNNNINNNLEKYLDGYWLSENNFLKLSGIDNLILYLDIVNNFGYLVIIKNKKIIHNVEFTINYNNSIKIDNNNPLENISFNISFNSLDDEFIWNNKIFNAILSINDGNLKLFENNTLFGNLFKENKISYYLKNI